ncbi:MAG TPA: rhodanese-like domain-containing protein [Gammaproteobacteria bacterium]|nr:rhodanese-like domain-containing protein [Gammaproteobacteria bacterium]
MITIDAKILRSWQIDQRYFILVDTLPLSAYEKGHLPGAISIASDDIIELAPLRLPDKDTVIVVYCASKECKRAGLAAERLEVLGYTRITYFSDGKKGWVTAGYLLE